MKLIERVVMVLFGLLLSQFPLFVDQYEMRLQAHISEVHLIVAQFEEIAKKRSKPLEEYISKFVRSDDLDIQEQGFFMERSLARYERLLSFQKRIVMKSGWFRPIIFPISCDLSIALETWSFYSLGLFFTEATAIWAFFGAVLGYSIMTALSLAKRAKRVAKEQKAATLKSLHF
ncbi:MAG: DUF2937 family protein [Chlamydia sp.]